MVYFSVDKYISENNIFSIWKLVICIITITLIATLQTIYFESNSNAVTNLLQVKQENLDSLLNTILQVYAGLTTVTVSLLALIVGFNKEKKYGMRVLDFMIIQCKYMPSFFDEIVLNLLLIFLGYVFVAYRALSGIVFIFVLSILIIIHMLYQIIKVTVYTDKIENEMKEYFRKECIKRIKLEEEF